MLRRMRELGTVVCPRWKSLDTARSKSLASNRCFNLVGESRSPRLQHGQLILAAMKAQMMTAACRLTCNSITQFRCADAVERSALCSLFVKQEGNVGAAASALDDGARVDAPHNPTVL